MAAISHFLAERETATLSGAAITPSGVTGGPAALGCLFQQAAFLVKRGR